MLSFLPLDKPNKQVTGDPKRTVFVARLSHDTSEGSYCQISVPPFFFAQATTDKFYLRLDVLKEIFSKYGKIEKCQLIRDIGGSDQIV